MDAVLSAALLAAVSMAALALIVHARRHGQPLRPIVTALVSGVLAVLVVTTVVLLVVASTS